MPSTAPSPYLVGLLALTAGATVANLYYSQPVLGAIARDFAAPARSVALVVAATQLGYACGLLLVVSYFFGGTLGSALGSWAWTRAGWPGVCWCGAALTGLGLLPLLGVRRIPTGIAAPPD